MRNFRKIFAAVLVVLALIMIGANSCLLQIGNADRGRPWRVEVNRISLIIEEKGLESVDLSEFEYVKRIATCGEDVAAFYNTDSDYIMREIHGELYRFDYAENGQADKTDYFWLVNGALLAMLIVIITVLLFVRQRILSPFQRLSEVPYELAKGNLAAPLKESKNRFFGRFVWGVDLLRENMEQARQRELELQKSKKTLLLSLSHDIKTPLSAIKLYSQALSKGLYFEEDKQKEIADNINRKADEIEGYVSQIISASREDFLELDVKPGEFYLSGLLQQIAGYYGEKLALIKTEFVVAPYSDCLLNGDLDRSIEVVQNIMENAIKYGDGRRISLTVTEEEGCSLLVVRNSGCNLSGTEFPHIFESFWRGSNATGSKGSGLGLYICRQLMNRMGGEVFAEMRDEDMMVTVVFTKA